MSSSCPRIAPTHRFQKIRIYGMTYFNEHDEYWGNATTPILAKGDGRLTARSVKMFADGNFIGSIDCTKI
jgi:hypothetical protein